MTPGNAWRRDLACLALGFGTLYVLLLGHTPLANPDEPRYAQIPREMMAAGDGVLGRLNGVPYLEKPPLMYWVVGWCHRLFGAAEWSMRLPAALFGLAGVLLTYAAARAWRDRASGIAAAIVLGTSLMYFVLSRVLLLDMALTFFISAALFCFLLGTREPPGPRRRWFFYGLYASAALATLTKGLIGFLLPGAIMFFWLLVFNQWRRLRPFHLAEGAALFLLLAAPWHVLAAQRHPAWADFYLVHEHWRRFAEPGHGRTEPWWFFGPVLVFGFFPWIGFLPGAVRAGVGRWAARLTNADAWFLLVWAAFVFLFFNLSASKLVPYILPLFPPLAVLVGASLAAQCQAPDRPGSRAGFGAFGFLCGLIAMAVLVLVLKAGAIRDPEQAARLRPFGIALGVLLLLGGVIAPWTGRVRGNRAALSVVLATTLGFFFTVVLASPHFQRADTRSLALVVRERARPADRVYHFWGFFHDFVFYSERPVGLVSYTDELEVQFLDPAERAERFIDDATLRRQWAGEGRVWVVLRKRDLEHFRRHVVTVYHSIAEGRGHYLLSNQP